MPQTDPVRTYKVLVVEDEGLIALDIAGRLEALGHEVIGPVSTAEEAIELAALADIVLMDIRIDGQRDGIDAAMEIRAHNHLPVIFLTAHADRATLDRAKLAGPFGYIVKPLGPASLQTGIEMAVAKHRVDRLLEEREAWLRAAIGCIADGAVVTTPQGRVRLMNRAAEELTGWTQADAEGQAVEKIVHLTDADSGEELDPLAVALIRDKSVDFNRRFRLTARDGRELEIEGSVAPVRVSENLLGAVMTFRDASARRWEERQLRQAQRLEAASRLASSAAGEYSNLVILIRNHTEQLLRQFSDYSAVRPMLEDIFQAASAADRITRRLAAFGTRQVGQPEILSVNGILRRMTPLLEGAAGDRIRLAVRPSPGAGRIKADASQLEAALMSLVTHACSAVARTASESGSQEAGQILIETARVDLPHAGRTAEYTMLAMVYSAIEPDIERLFDPDSAGDSGLALAVVHSVIAEYGGYVSAHSGREGGSRIEILLPRVNDQVLLPAAANGSGGAVTVLVVEPSDAVRAELHNFFEAEGYNLLEACDAREAVALGEMHEGSLEVLVAAESEAGPILESLRAVHPALESLQIVDEPERDFHELRRPFTQKTLLARISSLTARRKAQTVTSS